MKKIIAVVLTFVCIFNVISCSEGKKEEDKAVSIPAEKQQEKYNDNVDSFIDDYNYDYNDYDYEDSYPELCMKCGGRRSCRICGGSGVYTFLNQSNTCTSCNGSGKCNRCNGSGYE